MGLQVERLYYGDSYLREFASVVTEVKEKNGDPWVRFRESAFYPTSGGQPCDTGIIIVEAGRDRYLVTGVEVEDGQVWHRTSGHLEVGQAVTGQIDWTRRFDFMQQHSGQHILSACFEQAMGANTSSFHMGDTYSSIDLDVASLSDQEVRSVMLEANRWIWCDAPIRARFVSEHELASMQLSKPPSVAEDIRIVTIEGLEDNACGGTHPSSTGQVGQILVTKTERMRRGVRVTFVCGTRALSSAKEAVDMVRTMATGLSIGNTELLDAVNALQNQVKESNRKYEAIRGKYASLLARDLAAHNTKAIRGTHVLFVVLPDLDEVQELKRMAGFSSEWIGAVHPSEPQLIVFAGELGGRTHVVVQATAGAMLGADVLIKDVLPALNGKGGGNANAAQGSAPAPVQQVAATIESVLAAYD